MSSIIIKSLENPQYLSNSCNDFDKHVIIFTDQQKSDAALKILVELYKLLDKPTWKNNVDGKLLCLFSSHLSQHIKNLSQSEMQRYLATICTIHRTVVKKKVSPTMSLSLAKLVFLNSDLKMSPEYNKLYWIILVDCVSAIDSNNNIKDTKIVIDIVIQICEITNVQFCKENLPWLLRKFFVLLNTSEPDLLNDFYEKLFTSLIKNNDIIGSVKIDNEFEIYKSLLFCCTILLQNISSRGYKAGNSLTLALKFSTKLFKSNVEFSHLMQSLYKMAPVLTANVEIIPSKTCNLISDFMKNIDIAKESQHTVALKELCCVLRKMLHMSLSYWVTVDDHLWKKSISIEIQCISLQLIIYVTKILNHSDSQVVKCINCKYKSAIHDSIVLGCFPGMFATKSAKSGLDISALIPLMEQMSSEQMNNLKMLRMNGCPNWKIFWSKMENDLHNDGILLYSMKYYKESCHNLKLFVTCFTRVLNWDREVCDLNHLSRGLYNLSICLSDLQKPYEALIGCYISMALNSVSDTRTGQEMAHSNFAMQIKSKVVSLSQSKDSSEVDKSDGKVDHEMKNEVDQEYSEKIQTLTVWKACKEFLLDKRNSIYWSVFSKIDFGQLVLTELQTYIKVWPSTLLLVGICQSLQEMCHCASSVPPSQPERHTILGVLNTTSLTITCGKVVTLITTQPSKLNNPQIHVFCELTLKLLDDHFKTLPLEETCDDATVVKLLLANTLLACSTCESQVKRKLGAASVVAESAPAEVLSAHQPPTHPDDACDVTPAHQYLGLTVEDTLLQPLYRAIHLWREGVKHIGSAMEKFLSDEDLKSYIDSTASIVETACQVLALHDADLYSVRAADIAYSLALLTENRVCSLRSAGFLLEHAACGHTTLEHIIHNTNKTAMDILKSDDNTPENSLLLEATFEYLLNLSIFYYNNGLKNDGFLILNSVNNRILEYHLTETQNKRKFDDIKTSYTKLIVVHSLYNDYYRDNKSVPQQDSFGILTALVNAHMECGELIKTIARNGGRTAAMTQRLWLETGALAGRTALALGLVRRARALLRAPLAAAQKLLLPRRAARALLLLATADLAAERHDDCTVKLEGIRYILGEQDKMKKKIERSHLDDKKIATSKKQLQSKNTLDNDRKHFEMVLDAPADRYCSTTGSPTFHPPPFTPPDFLDHLNSCSCHKCSSISNILLYLDFTRVQAQLHFKSGESNITSSFYNGGLNLLKHFYAKIKYIYENNCNMLVQSSCVGILENLNSKEMIYAECQFFLDANYFFITENEIEKALNFNTKVLLMLAKVVDCDLLLVQSVEEQRMFLLQVDVFKKENENQSQLDIIDDLQSDFNSKMIITPEKKKNIVCFMTPSDKKINAMNKIKKNLGNTLPKSTRQIEFTNFARPAIKMSLDDDEDESNLTKPPKSDTKQVKKLTTKTEVDAVKTPAPILKNQKKIVLFDSAPKTSRTRARMNLDSCKANSVSGNKGVVSNNKETSKLVSTSVSKTPGVRSRINLDICKNIDFSNSSSDKDSSPSSQSSSPIFPAASSASKVRVYGNNRSKLANGTNAPETGKLAPTQSSKSLLNPKEDTKIKVSADVVKKYSTRRKL